jgi:type I restriction enzyme, S subunit
MSFTRYSSYKYSGVEWLGMVPEHWLVIRAARLFKEVIEEGSEELPILSVSIHDGVSDDELDPEELDRKVARSDDRSKYKRVEPGDLVYNMMRAWQGGFGTVRVTGMVSPAYVVARPKLDLSTVFVEHLLRTPNAIEEMRRHSQGVTDFRLRLYWDQFKDLNLVLPPLSEQTAITSFLDRETAIIDALVEEQQRLIELLREKRQAVISRAVSKGLDPNVPMKPSGVEWLDEVPEHWTVSSVGRVCSHLSYGFTNPMPTAEDGPFMLTANDIDYGEIRYDTARRTTQEAFEKLLTDKSRPKAGDILLTKDGTLGRVAVHDGQFACINQSVAVLRPDTKILPSFLALALGGGVYQQRMIYEAGGTTIKHIYISRLAKMAMAMPELTEQKKIVEALQRDMAKFDALIAEGEMMQALLQERRTALISAAVTGKIDVRGLVECDAPVLDVVAA